MKVRDVTGVVHIELTPAEARVFLEELSHVRGGARLQKIRQVCAGLEALFSLTTWRETRKKDQVRSISLTEKDGDV
jgi:hypothetical protein